MVLRLGYVAGVSPGRWVRTWADRRPDQPLEATRVDESAQLDGLVAGEHDLAFVRLPIDVDDDLHTIPLWEELAVAVLPKDHAFADADALQTADLDGEPLAPVQPDAAMTIELVAAGTGYAIVPHGVARLHHRKDVVAIPLTDAPPTRIALVWFASRDDADIQEFVGVVRGRSARSSRGDGADGPAAADSGTGASKAGAGKGKGTGTGAGSGKTTGKPARKPGAGRGASARARTGRSGGKSGGIRRSGGKGKRR